MDVRVLIHGAAGLFVAFVGSIVISLIRAPKLLDDDRQKELVAARSTIEAQTARMTALERKPSRTDAEQHHYDIAKAAIDKHGDEGRTVLKHLRLHRQLVFNFWKAPPLPPGMTTESLRGVLNELEKSNVVAMVPKQLPGGFEYTYALAPGLENVMDELLY